MIGMGFHDVEYYPFYVGTGIEDFIFQWYGIVIHPVVKINDINIFTSACLVAAGITKEKALKGFSSSVKTVL